jgi:acyl-CoA thioesterase-1
MPLYMYEAAYTGESWAAQMKNPQNRVEAVGWQACEAVGGKLIGGWYLDKLGRACLLAFALFVGCAAAANSASAQIVALGASNTAGRGVSTSEAFPAQLEGMLRARGSSTHVTNAGVSGDTTGGMLSRLSSSVPDGTKIVIVQYGGNDNREAISPAVRQANIASIEQQLRARGIKVVRADGLVRSARSSGLVQSDGVHLSAAGHQRVASELSRMVR